MSCAYYTLFKHTQFIPEYNIQTPMYIFSRVSYTHKNYSLFIFLLYTEHALVYVNNANDCGIRLLYYCTVVFVDKKLSDGVIGRMKIKYYYNKNIII